jgi:hypothetical protein
VARRSESCLVANINAAVPQEQRRKDAELDVLFPLLWPRIEAPVNLVLQGAVEQGPQAPAAEPNWGAISTEILALLRQQSTLLASPEKLLEPVLIRLDSEREMARERANLENRDAIEWARRQRTIFVAPSGRRARTILSDAPPEEPTPTPQVDDAEEHPAFKDPGRDAPF